MAPGFEQGLVGGGGPERAHDGGAVLQVFDGLEERDGLEAGVRVLGIGAALYADTAETGEANDVEDVFGRGGAADDVAREGFGDEVALELGDGAEGGEDFGGLGREGGGDICAGLSTRGVNPTQAELGWGTRLRGLGDFGDSGGVDAGVLANVEGLQVKAVGADLQQQRVEQHPGEAAAVVLDQAGTDDAEVADELRGAGVRLERGVGRQRDGHVGRAAEAHHDAADEQADGLVGDAIFERGLAGFAELDQVAFEDGGELGRDGHEAVGAGELVEDVLQTAAVVGEQQAAGHGERFAGGFGRDEGIAVAVAADPGTEADQLGQLHDGRFDGVFGGQGGGDFGVEHGQRGEDGGLVIVERHADLVAHGGADVADVVGLPEGGDLGDDVLLEGFELLLGDGDAVELLEQVGDAAALEHDGAAGDLGGVRGEDRHDADALEQGAGLAGGDAGELHLAERAAQGSALGLGVGVELAGEAAALAVVGFGEVDELEVKGEGAGELIGGGFAERFDAAQRVLERVGGQIARSFICLGAGGGARRCGAGIGGRSGVHFAVGDGGLAQLFDGLEDGDAGLLAQDFAEQHAEGADVAAQRRFLELAGGRLQFRQALRPVGRRPERGHK